MMLVLRFFNKRSSGSSLTLVFSPKLFSFFVLVASFLFQRFGPFEFTWLVFGIAELSRHIRVSHVIEYAFDKSNMVQLGSGTYHSYAVYRQDTHSLLVCQIFLIFS